jgi:hypothetical protein
MNPNYTEFKFPQIKAHPWHKVFHKRMPPEAVDLVSRLLQYSPNLRCNAVCFLSWLFLTLFTTPVDGKWISLVWNGALLSYQADHVELD